MPASPAPEFALSVFGAPRFVNGRPSDREPTLTQRRILERLALTPATAVPIEELVDAVWESDPPRHARAAVQNQISRIRATWGEDVVVTEATGYALGVTTDAVRLHELSSRAEVLLEDGDARAAFDLAESVVPLWAGRPFTAIEHVEGVAARRRGLSASCKGAENTRLAAGIALGRSAWAVAEAERLVAETPLDERRQAMLARALALAGRRGDALAALASASRLVRRELGIEPGVLLREAEAEIRGGAGSPVARITPPFVGRQAQVRRALAQAAATGIARIVGEPGSGLTRLLDELTAHLGALGIRVLRVDALEHLDRADGVLRDALEQLGAEPAAGGVVASFADAISAGAEARPVAVLVDDAQGLGPTARGVLAVAAARPGVSVVLAGHGDGWLEEGDAGIPLPPLGVDDVARIMRTLGREVDAPASAAEVHAYCGGNPLAVTLLLASDDAGAGATARGLGALATTLLAGLDQRQRDLVERVAIAGDGVVDAPEDVPLPDVLERDAGGRPRFRHGVLRDLVEREIPPARREELHRDAAIAAVASGAPRSVIAHHRRRAGSLAEAVPVDRSGVGARQ